MNYIVGDIGNTSTRICLLNSKYTIKNSLTFDTNKIFKGNYSKKIKTKFTKIQANKTILISSVVPLALKSLKNI